MEYRSTPLSLNDVTVIEGEKLRKAIVAATLGNALEYFDFGVYGYLVTILGVVFFPAADSATQLISALATFSVPFLIRPFGGMFFGVLGDKYGRQKILVFTVILMTLSTFCIGFIPSYATIGIWAPICLLLCKLVQGFSIGGEFAGATVFVAEYSPDRKRGLMGSFLDFGAILGFLLGAGVVEFLRSLLGQDALADWGWRIPFFMALPLGIIGIYLRHALEETPTFKQHSAELAQKTLENPEERQTLPFKEIVAQYWRPLLLAIGLVISSKVIYYVLLIYLPSYLEHCLGYSADKGMLIIIATMTAVLFIQPLIGLLSDRIGRRPFIFLGSLGALFLSIIIFKLIGSYVEAFLFLGLFLLAVVLNCFIGVTASILPEIFPTKVRYSALASAYNISIIVAGLTPTILAWLVHKTNDLMMPAYYVMFVGFIGLITAFFMKETANKPLHGARPAASDLEEAKALLEAHHETVAEHVLELDKKIGITEESLIALKQERQHFMDNYPHLS